MAGHKELDELAGKDRDYNTNNMSLRQKKIDQDLDQVISDSIRKNQSPVDETRMPTLSISPDMINRNFNKPRHIMQDPEDLGEWPFRKGPEDYPDDNEG